MERTEKDLQYGLNYFEKADVVPANRKHIEKFLQQITAEGLSKARQAKYIYALIKLDQWIGKDFIKANKQDLIRVCGTLENSDYTDNTIHDYKAVMKRYYRWLREDEGLRFDVGEYPKEVSWIKTTIKKKNHKLPKQLLSIEDVKKLANHTNNMRDRALILFLYESGCRIGEALNIKIKDLQFDKYGAKVNLKGKTGSRVIRIISSTPSISNWLIGHPRKEDGEAYLFCGIWGGNKGKVLNYRHVNNLLKQAAKKADINKPVNPHHFRHSRASKLAQKLTEAQLCQYLGWVQGSSEASVYVHLSGRDSDKAILEMHGLAKEEKTKDKFAQIECPRCKTVNDPAANVCSHCSLGLDEKSIMEYDKHKEDLAQSSLILEKALGKDEFDKLIEEKMKKLLKEYDEKKHGDKS